LESKLVEYELSASPGKDQVAELEAKAEEQQQLIGSLQSERDGLKSLNDKLLEKIKQFKSNSTA